MTCQVSRNIATPVADPRYAGTTSSKDAAGRNAHSKESGDTSHEKKSQMAS